MQGSDTASRVNSRPFWWSSMCVNSSDSCSSGRAVAFNRRGDNTAQIGRRIVLYQRLMHDMLHDGTGAVRYSSKSFFSMPFSSREFLIMGGSDSGPGSRKTSTFLNLVLLTGITLANNRPINEPNMNSLSANTTRITTKPNFLHIVELHWSFFNIIFHSTFFRHDISVLLRPGISGSEYSECLWVVWAA